jgi:hypothetical protein
MLAVWVQLARQVRLVLNAHLIESQREMSTPTLPHRLAAQIGYTAAAI